MQSDYLDQVCAGDQALRERVEALLHVHEQEQSFLKSNGGPAPTVDQPAPTEAVGQQIGRAWDKPDELAKWRAVTVE